MYGACETKRYGSHNICMPGLYHIYGDPCFAGYAKAIGVLRASIHLMIIREDVSLNTSAVVPFLVDSMSEMW